MAKNVWGEQTTNLGDVKRLKEATGYDLHTCHAALRECGGSYDEALELLNECEPRSLMDK